MFVVAVIYIGTYILAFMHLFNEQAPRIIFIIYMKKINISFGFVAF